MKNLKTKIKAIAVLLSFAVSMTFIGNQIVFAQEETNRTFLENYSYEQNRRAANSLDSDGLLLFGISSNPFSGGEHPGENRQIFCCAQIDPTLFSSHYTDYIIINWNNSQYRFVQGSEEIYVTYYTDFFGQIGDVEKRHNFNYVGEGVRSVAVDIETYVFDDWKYSEVTKIFCFIIFELEPVNNQIQTEIYANYFHASGDVSITGIGFNIGVGTEISGGLSISWNNNTQVAPIWGEMDYIWEE